jgi:SAC3 family protein LENG8/THP3
MTAPAQQPEPQKAETAAPSKVVWPDSVRNYVSQSFHPENDDPAVSRREVEAKLKEVIRAATENGTLYTIDWNTMASPQQLVKAEREAYASQALFSKKRKSSDLSDDAYQTQPRGTWPTTNPRSSLQDRVTIPASSSESAKSSKFQKDTAANKRKRRFENEYRAYHGGSSPPVESSEPTTGPIVGTCETLEKRYLRLTAPPVPSMVRPERILSQTLDLLKKKWRKEGNYSYICDQFKSMRQDLTVQHIKNDFTVSVYEIHARIALEKGDIGEYNQCQTQLRSLYSLGLKGNHVEFKAYRILYYIHTANRTGLNDTLLDLTTAEKKERPIRHALDVRSSLALGNYHRFFQLYMDTPNMGAYLMDMFIVRERLAAMCNICRA